MLQEQERRHDVAPGIILLNSVAGEHESVAEIPVLTVYNNTNRTVCAFPLGRLGF